MAMNEDPWAAQAFHDIMSDSGKVVVQGCNCPECMALRHDASLQHELVPQAPDTVPGDASTTATIAVGSSVDVSIDTLGDHDWYRVTLTAGTTYTFHTSSDATRADTFLSIRNSAGTEVASDDDSGDGVYSLTSYTPTVSGTYYVDASTYNNETTGTYHLSVAAVLPTGSDSVAGSTGTTANLALNGSIDGNIDTGGDHDFYRVTLTAGQTYIFRTGGTTATDTTDTIMTLRDASGNQISTNDDAGEDLYSAIRYTATSTGTYYLDVSAFGQLTGAFNITAFTTPTPTVYNNDQIANQLTNGYWGGASHHFNVAPGGTLTFNVQGLTADGQNLARQALLVWTDVTGINFSEVTTGGQIVYDDAQTGAFATASYSNGITTSANVNVGTAWLTSYGTGLNTYSFQTYLHETGHALGLGHAGNYNSSASYASDSLYLNDAWATTVMSYFDQTENTYFQSQGFTREFVLTPMAADAVATTNLYGAATTTRTGNTTYGFNNNSGRALYDATANAGASYTIYDNGGTDTLDYSGFSNNQLINLNAETFSNVGARIGNVTIARGAVIENAIGGSGSDTIIGNAANNDINGGTGTDNLYGGLGNDTFRVDQQADVVFENANEGTDSVISTSNFYLYANIENLTLAAGSGNIFGVGNELANSITGNEGNNTLLAGAGIDIVHGGAGVDIIYGEDGNDQLFGDADNDFLAGGLGDDVMDGGAGGDSVYGEGGNDTLYGGTTFEFDRLVGGDGNDILHGDSGQADYDYLYGNAGDDSFYVDTGDDLTFENAGEGTDTVYANVAGANNGVYLYANIENLVLLGTTTFGVGNELANTMTGNASANYLLGGDGNDVLNGMAGNDVLFGQGGADIFVFGSGTGGDVIGDFVPNTDRIDLSAFAAFTSFAAVQARMVENGGNTAIDLGNGSLVVINGVTNAQLHAGDFILPGGGSSDLAPLDAMVTIKPDVMTGHDMLDPHARSFIDSLPLHSLPDLAALI